MAERFAENPLIQPRDVRPSRDDFEVVCTFNAGAVRFGGRTLLLVRVAERPKDIEPGWHVAPWLDPDDVLLAGAPPLLFYDLVTPGASISVRKDGATVRLELR